MKMREFSLARGRSQVTLSEGEAIASSDQSKKRVKKFSRSKISFLLGIILLGILALAACGGSQLADSGTPQSPDNGSSESSPTANLEPAPNFRFNFYQGEKMLAMAMSLSNLQGKPLVLNFWAGLCPPCRAEMPDLQEFYGEFGDRVNLFGLDIGPFVGLGSREDGRDLLEDLNISYPAGSTLDETVAREYEILGMPTTVFITADGKIFRKWTGLLNRDKLVEITEEMLALSGPAASKAGDSQ